MLLFLDPSAMERTAGRATPVNEPRQHAVLSGLPLTLAVIRISGDELALAVAIGLVPHLHGATSQDYTASAMFVHTECI